MKKELTFLSFLACAGCANATLLVYEGFDYAVAVNGANSQNGGTGWTAAWDNPANGGDITAGSMAYTDGGGRSLVTSGNRYFGDSTNLATPGTAGTTITNFRNLSGAFDTAATGGATTAYFSLLGQQISGNSRAMNMALFTSVANNGVYTSTERISIGHGTNQPVAASPTDVGTFTWGAFVFGGGNNGALPQVVGSNYSAVLAQTLSFLVLRIDINASGLDERYRLYINPSLDAEPGAAQVDFLRDSLVSLNEIDQVRPFAGNSQTNAGVAQAPANTNFDELRFGTAWADVTPFTVVPEPCATTMGLLALAGLISRRRR